MSLFTAPAVARCSPTPMHLLHHSQMAASAPILHRRCNTKTIPTSDRAERLGRSSPALERIPGYVAMALDTYWVRCKPLFQTQGPDLSAVQGWGFCSFRL